MTNDDPASLPTVSVVISTRNRPQLLREAVDAVLAQTYPGKIECIAVFDQCEPDHDLARVDEHRSVRVLTNDRSPGLAGGRNTGILASDHDYVAFCDDDDLWLATKLAKQIDAMRAADAPTAVTGITVVYGDRETDRVPTESDLELDTLIRKRVTAAHPSTVIVRRQHLLDAVGLVDNDIPGSYGEDFDFLIRAARAGSIAVVPEPLVRVRWGQSQFSQNWDVIIKAIDYQLDKHPTFELDGRAKARLYGRRAFALAAAGRRREAFGSVATTVRADPRELRAYLATAVALRMVTAHRLMDIAHKRGHGI